MGKLKFMSKCELCGSEYQQGPHLYEGRHSQLFDLWVCSTCWEYNWDGWADHYEEKLLKHIESKQLPIPERNPNGLFPRG